MLTSTNEEMVVTPWRVAGSVDYDKLIRQFGTQPLDAPLLRRLERHAGTLHPLLKREFFFSHRDLHLVLDHYEQGQPFVLYTGRGPSGPVHLGHVVPWIFTKYLQDVFDVKLYFQLTDDEKFLIHPEHSLDAVHGFARDNILDIIAMGFDSAKTRIILDTRHIATLYTVAVRVARHVNFSTVKAVFGFEDSSNIGIIFFPAIQAAPAFLESATTGRPVPCLIPAAIDQDPYWRVSRDVAPKLGFPKPAQIHSKFLPGLGKGGKMSSSLPETCIFMTDTPEAAAAKIGDAFTGGQATVQEQRQLGGRPEICPVYLYQYFALSSGDDTVNALYEDCRNGSLLCGECKARLAETVGAFLRDHQARRERARDRVDQFLL